MVSCVTPCFAENFTGRVALRSGDAQQDVLGRDVFVFQALRFFERALQNFVGFRAQVLFRASGNFRQPLHLFLNFTGELRGRHTKLFEQGRHDAVTLRKQRPKDVQGLNLLLSIARSHFLRSLHRFLGL